MTFLRLALSLILVLLHAVGTASPLQNASVADNPCGRFGKLFSVAVGLYGAVGAGTDRNSFEGHTLVHARVLTDTGYQTRLKPIADIQIGDEVLAWDELQAHDNAAVLKQASLEEKEAVFRRGYSIVSYDNNSNADAKAATSVSAKAVVSAPSAPSAPSAQRYEKVTDTFSSVKEQTLLHITLSNGQTLQATQGHPFKTVDGWRDAILLKKGGKLLLKGGDADDAANVANGATPAERYTTITDIRTEVKTLPVFNLEVANLHTFFVGEDGVVVHNGGRSGKQKKFKDSLDDETVPSHIKGWITQEMNSIKCGRQKNIRNPPGYEMAHKRGKRAKDGFGYEHSDFQNPDLHRLEHKYEGY
jgi:Bacterial toxin 8